MWLGRNGVRVRGGLLRKVLMRIRVGSRRPVPSPGFEVVEVPRSRLADRVALVFELEALPRPQPGEVPFLEPEP